MCKLRCTALCVITGSTVAQPCVNSQWHGWISTKFCTAVEVEEIITGDTCFSDRLRDVDSVGGQK